ncbi:STAS domain-containing protein [Rubrivirga sp.]|uniref:STAS domain-containing protein n=1 Tax=Rubrivirga sp. TaxID=1885344 RepID=UPI003B51B2A3
MSAYEHDLDVQITPRDGAAVATIVGNVDTVTADRLTAALQGAIGDGHVRLVGDLSGVGYTSSAGLRALLGAMKEARRGGGDLRLAAVGDKVLKVLQLSGFTSILRLYDDVDAALASYAE